VGKENIEQNPKMDEGQEVPEDLGVVDEIADESGEEGPDIEMLQEEIAETKERMLRIAADAENFKKRMERDKEKMLKYAGENIFRELLPTVDNLGRALEQGRADGGDAQQKLDALLEGVELVNKGFLSILEKFDVTPIESVGQEFNPDEMDALTMEASDKIPKNHVVQEFARGYRFKDRVLRHAQVVVSSGNSS
jgi:molecular chaperone GrpE